ncbi:MAG: hypothetical protein ACR2RB_13620, partial [Gammaproteobacteria bacterium]
MDAPLIDKRKREDIVAATEKLARAYATNWKPPAGGKLDPGLALIHIFARFAELGIERINKAPEKNLLAFLNLIGTEVSPPRPARVPLTFRVAANSPVDATVPTGTRAAAAPLAGEEEEVSFETERDLVATRAQLKAVFVRDTETDRYSDRLLQASGQKDEAFAAFQGDQAVPHEIYIACDELLTQQAQQRVMLILNVSDTWQWTTWPIEWSYWDGAAWQRKDPTKTELQAGAWQVTLGQVPELKPHSINGVQAGWLRARLKLPLLPAKKNLVPESVASGRSNPHALTLPFQPFGETAAIKPFYLSADEAFQAGGAIAKLQVTLARPGKPAVSLKWSIRTGKDQWTDLSLASFAFADDTQALTVSGEVRFRLPVDWQRTLHATRTGRWLRVEITAGVYAERPRIGSLTVGYDWELPGISAISLRQLDTLQRLQPEMTYFNGSAIDLSKGFYPFGEQPRYNDTFYVACEQALAKPGGRVTLETTLVNPADASAPPIPKVLTSGAPQLTWEVWNGRSWEALANSEARKNPDKLTHNGRITFTLPGSIAPATVEGEQKHWLRARITGGHYGEDATVRAKTFTVETTQDGKKTTTSYEGFETVAATYAPPVVQSIEFIPDASPGRELPVSACLTNNDFVFRNHTADAAKPGGTPFPPFTITEDTRPALYLGLDRPFDPRPTTLYVRAEPPLPEHVAADKLAGIDPATLARLVWEYAGPAGWTALGALDRTQGLARRDLVHFVGPHGFTSRPLFGHSLYWLRVRWHSGAFPLMPGLRRVLLNTTWAAQVTTSRDEILGSSNGNAGQTFQAAQAPVQPGQQVQVREAEMPAPAEQSVLRKLEGADAITVTLDATGQPDEIWVRWHPVSDFYSSGSRDRHYIIDAATGKLRFGDGRYGLLPPVGQNNVRITYRTGGGVRGNRPANTVAQLKSSVPYIDAVTNHEPATGGVAQE